MVCAFQEADIKIEIYDAIVESCRSAYTTHIAALHTRPDGKKNQHPVQPNARVLDRWSANCYTNIFFPQHAVLHGFRFDVAQSAHARICATIMVSQ